MSAALSLGMLVFAIESTLCPSSGIESDHPTCVNGETETDRVIFKFTIVVYITDTT